MDVVRIGISLSKEELSRVMNIRLEETGTGYWADDKEVDQDTYLSLRKVREAIEECVFCGKYP